MNTVDLAIDFGNDRMRVYFTKSSKVNEEPAIIAFNKREQAVSSIGRDAYNKIGRVSDDIIFVRPFKDGVVTDLAMGEYIFARFLNKINTGKLMLPSIAVCVPTNITQVERQVIYNLLEKNGVRKFRLVDRSVAIARRLSITKNKACMLVDIGQTHCSVTAIKDREILVQKYIDIGGMEYTNTLISYMRAKHDMAVGFLTAEEAKRSLACVSHSMPRRQYKLSGKDILSGLPIEKVISSDDLVAYFIEVTEKIAMTISYCKDSLTDEILTEITETGVRIVGGGAKVSGLTEFISRSVNLPCRIAENPETCALLGSVRSGSID